MKIFFIIVLIIIIILCGFFKHYNEENTKLAKEGGIYRKYRTLIDNFIDPESGMKVIQQTNNYMCVGIQNEMGHIVFHFQHTFDAINVQFDFKNLLFGDHKLEWDFPESMSQHEMITRIERDTKRYTDNVSKNFGFE